MGPCGTGGGTTSCKAWQCQAGLARLLLRRRGERASGAQRSRSGRARSSAHGVMVACAGAGSGIRRTPCVRCRAPALHQARSLPAAVDGLPRSALGAPPAPGRTQGARASAQQQLTLLSAPSRQHAGLRACRVAKKTWHNFWTPAQAHHLNLRGSPFKQPGCTT